jgi:hypothetical protein
MLGNIIGGFVVIIIGITLLPTVANEVEGASTGNVTGASATILDLTTLFFALGVATAGIAIAAIGLRQAGLLGV